MELYFVTHNEAKFKEAEQIGQEYDLTIEWVNIEYEEIQENNLEVIATASCQRLLELKPDLQEKEFFLEDAGLFIDTLKGFPGPYSSYVYYTIGNEGILKLMSDKENRKAEFNSVIAFYSKKGIELFKGITEGTIVKIMRGNQGFGFDPIFQPHSSKQTFAEMSLTTKNLYSHRQKSVRKLFTSLTTFDI
jgi:XTP/dITP diphosphohydrolase